MKSEINEGKFFYDTEVFFIEICMSRLMKYVCLAECNLEGQGIESWNDTTSFICPTLIF